MDILGLAHNAQQNGDLRQLGNLIQQTQDRILRGRLLGMLACEVALRQRDLKKALHLLAMSRRYLTDNYSSLRTARMQEVLIKQSCQNPKFASLILLNDASAEEG